MSMLLYDSKVECRPTRQNSTVCISSVLNNFIQERLATQSSCVIVIYNNCDLFRGNTVVHFSFTCYLSSGKVEDEVGRSTAVDRHSVSGPCSKSLLRPL